MKILDLLKLPNLFWETSEDAVVATALAAARAPDATAAGDAVLGSFALARHDDDGTYLVRDRLGLHKLFYAVDPARHTLTVGHYLRDVAAYAGGTAGVFSVPSGHVLRIDHDTRARRLSPYYDLGDAEADGRDGAFDLGAFHAAVDVRLNGAFRVLRQRLAGKRVFVCLSGGLDSTIIALLARRHLPNVTAVTFSFRHPLSDDFRAARAIASALRIPLVPVLAERELDPERLRDVLVHGQDWRDFNVHCAWVNDVIGEALRRAFPTDDLAVLTGDLMNEYVADYAEVRFKDAVYYPQMRIPKARRRHFFVLGLDAGDRELGIFARHGIAAIQPYAILAEHYLRVPAALLERPDAKEILNRPLLAGSGLESLVTPKKVRAQVGGEDGGVLGLFHDAGYDQDRLRSEWYALFGSTTCIRAGRYAGEG